MGLAARRSTLLLFFLVCIARCGGANPLDAPASSVSGMWQKFAPKFPKLMGADEAPPSFSGVTGVGGAQDGAAAGKTRVFSSNFDVNRPLPTDEELRAIEAENDRLARCAHCNLTHDT